MRELKFRTPVVCQNGHKALWYFELSQNATGIAEVNHIGVPVEQECKCPKHEFNEGWRRAGEDQQYIGINTWDGHAHIYEGDILQNGNYRWVVKRYPSGAYNVKVDDEGRLPERLQEKVVYTSINVKENA